MSGNLSFRKLCFTVHSNASALWGINVHGRGLPQGYAIRRPDWTSIHATKIPTRLFLLTACANQESSSLYFHPGKFLNKLRSLKNLEELISYRYWHWQSYGF